MDRNRYKEIKNEKVILAFFCMIFLTEGVHLLAIVTKLSFSACAALLGAFWGMLLLGLGASLLMHKKRQEGGGRFRRGLRAYPLLTLAVCLIPLLQILWFYGYQMPVTAGDITVETVQSMLASDGIYTVHPLTGLPFTEGMPMRLKILCLPTFYATWCRWTHIPAFVLVRRLAPAAVLLLSYYVYLRFARFFFPEDGKKQMLFLLAVEAIYQFGGYWSALNGSVLFLRGSQGEAIRACVILPYAFLNCLRENRLLVLACIVAEACLVWTLYGLGYTVLMAVVFLLIKAGNRVAGKYKWKQKKDKRE